MKRGLVTSQKAAGTDPAAIVREDDDEGGCYFSSTRVLT
jgi:hypothetical protein